MSSTMKRTMFGCFPPPDAPDAAPCPNSGRAANAPAPSPNIPKNPRLETIAGRLSEILPSHKKQGRGRPRGPAPHTNARPRPYATRRRSATPATPSASNASAVGSGITFARMFSTVMSAASTAPFAA